MNQSIQTPCPTFLSEETFTMEWRLSKEKIQEVWQALQKRETFVRGQIFPYRVEFDSKEQEGAFSPGEINIHHGPLLSAHGKIGKISENYRDLDYFFGSYVLSFRLIRPIKLEFSKSDDRLKMTLTSYVAPWFRPFYKFGLWVFWKFFGITFLF